MAIELIRRPLGHKISLLPVSAVIVDNGAGDAVVYVAGGHSLSDGDYVYIESNFDFYNGYKYVDATSYDYFKIQNSENSDPIEYVQDADISLYVSQLNHGWQCVHLPIVYELKSDLYPNNIAEEEYIPNTIVSFENSNGYVKLNLERGITGLQELNFIELVGTGTLAGPYQIISVVQPWAIVINLAYDAGLSFTGYQVVNYYNNYNINVEVWAGLDASHRWVTKKPYELAATLKFIPDSEGNVKFSIHEILKGYIETRNNLTLDTLPNNLDFHVGFYIKYYESYDLSDGETIATENGSTTTDDFEGVAVNAMLPFKSLNSGHMSDYIDGGGELAQWLTLFDRPVAIVDRFFDISFINQYDGFNIVILRNGELFQAITNPGSGIIRVMFIPESGFTEYCLQAFASGSASILSSSLQNNGDANEAWTLGVQPTVQVSSNETSQILYVNYSFISGNDYTVSIPVSYSGGATLAQLRSIIYNNSFVVQESESIFPAGTGSQTMVLTFTAGDGYNKIGFVASMGPFASSKRFNIDGPISISVNDVEITEQICIDIVEECGSTMNNVLRITDGDQLRRV